MSDKYPRTAHLPWSPSPTADDKRLTSAAHFVGKEVVVLEKIDGSNVAMTREALFARSHSGPPKHPSFNAGKAIHARLRDSLLDGVTYFGEYCFAVHSIEYERLPGYFILFGVRTDASGFWWDWSSVEKAAGELGLPVAPVLFRGFFSSEKDLRKFTEAEGKKPSVYGGEREGTVVRLTAGFSGWHFRTAVAKWVRKDHIKTDAHWMEQATKRQPLAEDA